MLQEVLRCFASGFEYNSNKQLNKKQDLLMQFTKLCTSKGIILFLFMSLFLLFNTKIVFGGTITLETIDDGQTYGYASGGLLNTDNDSTSLYRSGISYKSIFEFDLSSIPDYVTITDAALSLTFTRFIALDSWLPITINFYAYAGDGQVTLSDHSASATLVASVSYTEDQDDGTSLVLSLTDLDFIQTLLDDKIVNYLTIRVWCTNGLFSGNISSLENTTYEPVSLTLEYPSVPVPSALIILGSGLLCLAGITSRKR